MVGTIALSLTVLTCRGGSRSQWLAVAVDDILHKRAALGGEGSIVDQEEVRRRRIADARRAHLEFGIVTDGEVARALRQLEAHLIPLAVAYRLLCHELELVVRRCSRTIEHLVGLRVGGTDVVDSEHDGLSLTRELRTNHPVVGCQRSKLARRLAIIAVHRGHSVASAIRLCRGICHRDVLATIVGRRPHDIGKRRLFIVIVKTLVVEVTIGDSLVAVMETPVAGVVYAP